MAALPPCSDFYVVTDATTQSPSDLGPYPACVNPEGPPSPNISVPQPTTTAAAPVINHPVPVPAGPPTTEAPTAPLAVDAAPTTAALVGTPALVRLPETGQASGGLFVAAAIAVTVGAVARRAARRHPAQAPQLFAAIPQEG